MKFNVLIKCDACEDMHKVAIDAPDFLALALLLEASFANTKYDMDDIIAVVPENDNTVFRYETLRTGTER